MYPFHPWVQHYLPTCLLAYLPVYTHIHTYLHSIYMVHHTYVRAYVRIYTQLTTPDFRCSAQRFINHAPPRPTASAVCSPAASVVTSSPTEIISNPCSRKTLAWAALMA